MNAKNLKFYAVVMIFMCLLAIGVVKGVQAPSIEQAGDLNFRWILPPEYYRGNDFHEGRAWVQEKKDGPWTLFDTV